MDEAGNSGKRDAVPMDAHWIRFPRFFGDAMMIHAAIAPLRAAGLPLVAWGPGWVVDLFAGSSEYQAAVPDPERKYSPWKAAGLLRAHRPASLINFPKSNRAVLAAFLARVPLRLGCGDGGAWLFYTHSVAFYRQDTPFVDRYASVVARAFPQLGAGPFRPFRPRAEAMAQVAARRLELGLGRYVVLAPGANCENKRLSVASFAALGAHLLRSGITPVILGAGPVDQALAAAIRAQVPQAVDCVGQGGLAVSAAWIAGASALVGMDSGLAHLAAGCGTPTLAVFGPTRPRHSAPRGPGVRVVRREDLACLECMTFQCPVPGLPCMTGLSDDRLWRELKAALGTAVS
ncbi:MAG: glycosyltransferase family 9 protein [Holophaga sp.]|nr:glycosyltransferase family 9 protein [Holophaga sp.]